jgi:hypothetical protein
MSDGAPVLNTVIEVVEMNRLSDVLRPCAQLRGYNDTLDCWSEQLDKPNALWRRFQFPEQNARFVVQVQGEDRLAKFVSKTEWSQAQKEAGVGTAWLLALDASSGMGPRYGEAREVARQFIELMRPNDLMDIMIFGDQQVVHDSKWKTFRERNALVNLLNEQPSVLPPKSKDRALFNLIKTMTKDAFGDLGSTTGPQNVPLHQAMVFLSNGAGRGDAASASPSAEIFSKYLNQGRFPEDNTSLPKTPLPVISLWFPARGGLANDIYRNNDAQFMQSLANPEIGGYFNVIREGGALKGKSIINIVRSRFDAMFLVKWRLACLNTSVTQSFNLFFENTRPAILPDGTFKDVPIGVDPTSWPLDVDVARTKADADANPLFPGGTFRVYGDFCWGGDKGRAEAYFIPAGTKAPPTATDNRDPDAAKRAMQDLIAKNMRGGAIEASDTFVTLQVPEDEKVLEGTGDATTARVIVYDNRAKRASAVDERGVLVLKAKKKPLNVLLVAGLGGGAAVLLLLVLVLARGSGGGRRRGGGGGGRPAPAPIVAGGPGFGPSPPGGGQRFASVPAPAVTGGPPSALPPTSPLGPSASAPPPAAAPVLAAASGGAGAMAGTAGVVEVKCPACGMPTMAARGQAAVCFSCGQPVARELTTGEGGGAVPLGATFPAHRRAGRGAPSTSAQPLWTVGHRRGDAGVARRAVHGESGRGSAHR